jgi:hypothetical protein
MAISGREVVTDFEFVIVSGMSGKSPLLKTGKCGTPFLSFRIAGGCRAVSQLTNADLLTTSSVRASKQNRTGVGRTRGALAYSPTAGLPLAHRVSLDHENPPHARQENSRVHPSEQKPKNHQDARQENFRVRRSEQKPGAAHGDQAEQLRPNLGEHHRLHYGPCRHAVENAREAADSGGTR